MGSTWCDVDAWVRVCSRDLGVFAVKRENESALGHCEVLFLVPVPVVRRNKLLALGLGDGGGVGICLDFEDAVTGLRGLPFCRSGAVAADQVI